MASLSRGKDWQRSPVDFLSTLNMSKNTLAAPVGAFNIWDPKSNLWIPLKLFTVYTTALFPNIFFFVLQLCFITYLLMSWWLLQSGDHEEIGHASLNTLYQTEQKTKFLSALTSVRKKAGKSVQCATPPKKKHYKVLTAMFIVSQPSLLIFSGVP